MERSPSRTARLRNTAPGCRRRSDAAGGHGVRRAISRQPRPPNPIQLKRGNDRRMSSRPAKTFQKQIDLVPLTDGV